jgi:uncharacterized membrane protein YuzA (DUF378 family)
MKMLTKAASGLLIVGGLNWGLVALFDFDLVAWLFGLDFGETNAATKLVYGLVGASALVLAARLGQLAGTSRSGSRGRVGHPAAEA